MCLVIQRWNRPKFYVSLKFLEYKNAKKNIQKIEKALCAVRTQKVFKIITEQIMQISNKNKIRLIWGWVPDEH